MHKNTVWAYSSTCCIDFLRKTMCVCKKFLLYLEWLHYNTNHAKVCAYVLRRLKIVTEFLTSFLVRIVLHSCCDFVGIRRDLITNHNVVKKAVLYIMINFIMNVDNNSISF